MDTTTPEALSFSLPDMILTIKSEINRIIENEMRHEGLKNFDLKQSEPAAKVDNKPDRGPTCRHKIQAPPMPVKPLPMENLSDDELVGMTLQAIEAGFKQKWTKLTDVHRKDRIKEFASKFVADAGMSSENIMKVYESLRVKMLVEKSIKAKDFDYDEGTGVIRRIPGMNYDPLTGVLTMKTSKECENIAQTSNDVMGVNDKVDRKPSTKANTTKKTPKLMKTITRLKK